MTLTKRAFMVTAAGLIFSCLVGSDVTPTAFELGEDYVIGRDLDLRPYGVLPKGTAMRVTQHDHVTGYVCLSFQSAGVNLTMWGGELELMPFDSEDAIAAFNYQPVYLLEPPIYQAVA